MSVAKKLSKRAQEREAGELEAKKLFCQELETRGLVDTGQAIVELFGLHLDDLRHTSDGPVAPPVIAEARARFARHLHRTLGWSLAMVAELMNYKSRNMISYLIGDGEGPKHKSARRRAAKFAGKGGAP